jgi:putative peptidoglycan lipid II flippase
VPIAVIMIICSELFIRIIFQRGQFNESAVFMTKQALIYYLVGLPFYGLNQVTIPLFYAAKDTKTPVKIATFMVAFNIILNLILMQFMKHAGLAFATSITACVQFLTLKIILLKKLPNISLKNTYINIAKLIAIITILSIILYLFNKYCMLTRTFNIYLLKSLSLCFLSFIVLILSFNILKPEYYNEVRDKIKKRIKRR